jgi:putative hemolysin
MADALPQLVLVLVLVIVNAVFAGSEMALVSLRATQIERLRERGGRAAALADLATDPNRFLATIQIGITLAGFLASAAAAVALAEPLEEPLSFLGGAAGPASVVVVTLVLSYVTLVFGELAPKRVAMQRSEGWGLLVARPLAALSTLARPVVWVLSRSTDVAVKLMGGDPALDREEVTGEELRSMVTSQRSLRPEHRDILSGAFEIAERTLREIVRPRGDVLVLDSSSSVADALHELARAGHSRAPIAPGANLDHFEGFVHLRDLVVGSDADPVTTRVQPLPAMPESVLVLDALRRMQAQRVQVAVVVNEHGGAEGIVTLEDLIEEVVGEIYDEFDADLTDAVRSADGSIELSGRFPMHDLVELGVELPAGDYATVAGLVLDRLGHLPEGPGDAIVVDGWRLVVTSVHRRSIRSVRLEPVDADGGVVTEERGAAR